MMNRYALLFVAAIAAGGIASLAARGARTPVTPVPAAAPATTTLEVAVVANGVEASAASIPSGARVALAVTNARDAAVRVRLTGYEDRVDTGPLAPGATVAITFVADRPGEQFAWLVGDEPFGRLDVAGSHLVEGHR